MPPLVPLLLKKFLAAVETLAMLCSPVSLWLLGTGVLVFHRRSEGITGIWKGFGGLRDGGTGWNRCSGDLSTLSIGYMVINDRR